MVRRTSITILLVSLLLLFLDAPALAYGTISIKPPEAANHVGEQARVCGIVASAKYASRSRGAPTFLNLGQPYPRQVFTAVIWGSDRSKLTYPPESLRGSSICVRGLISLYRGKPQIIVHDPKSIERRSHD